MNLVWYVVRKVLYYSLEAEKRSTKQAREKAALYDKLGDLCCELKAYPAAMKFYGKQVSVCPSHPSRLDSLPFFPSSPSLPSPLLLPPPPPPLPSLPLPLPPPSSPFPSSPYLPLYPPFLPSSFQLNVAEACGFGHKELSSIYESLAVTHSDCGQFSRALYFYNRELQLWRGKPSQVSELYTFTPHSLSLPLSPSSPSSVPHPLTSLSP